MLQRNMQRGYAMAAATPRPKQIMCKPKRRNAKEKNRRLSSRWTKFSNRKQAISGWNVPSGPRRAHAEMARMAARCADPARLCRGLPAPEAAALVQMNRQR